MEHISLDPHRKAAAESCPAPVFSDAPGDDELALALARTRRVAIVGASPNPSRTSYQIAVWLMEHTPYELYLVNPAAAGEEILGHGFYDSLSDIPVTVDMVDVFRRAEHTPAIASAAVAANAKAVWLQLGISHADAMASARAAGLLAVQNRCIKVEYRRLEDRITSFRAL
ncbi:CoA-binding protein [Demequina gelatinilytica]|uniref:CoA-binding protein n=1 Tax=Demequina gelatinilytica TaxID=1638980 RepID=UPI0009E384C1|nr:CoA-binding protein [Demequina gelatinilytica]